MDKFQIQKTGNYTFSYNLEKYSTPQHIVENCLLNYFSSDLHLHIKNVTYETKLSFTANNAVEITHTHNWKAALHSLPTLFSHKMKRSSRTQSGTK